MRASGPDDRAGDLLEGGGTVGREVDDGDRLGLALLRERVGERRPAVDDPTGDGLLELVQVTERGVVDAVEHRRRGQGRATDADVTLAVGRAGCGHTCHEGVREDHHARVGRAGGDVGPDRLHGGGEDGLVAGRRGTEHRPGELGLEVGERVDGHGTVAIGHDDGLGHTRQVGAQVHAGGGDELGAEPESGG